MILKFCNNSGRRIIYVSRRLVNLLLLSERKRCSPFMVVKRLEVRARSPVTNPRTETTYGNFTSRGQLHTPRRGPRFVAARRDFGDDPLQREVFSDVARGCIRTLTARSTYMRMHDLCVGRIWRRLFTRRMCRCDNGLKHDAAGFYCSSVCRRYAYCLRCRQCEKPRLELYLTEIIFLSKRGRLAKNYIYIHIYILFFYSLNFDESAAMFWLEKRDFFLTPNLLIALSDSHHAD